jgi:predicted ATPase
LADALEATGLAAPELIAHHATKADLAEKAMQYWQLAGEAAMARPAYDEAISHLNAAIGMLGQLPDPSAWQERELQMQVQLAQVLLTREGYGAESAAVAFERASKLMEATGDTKLLVPVNYGRWIGHYLRAEHKLGSELGEKLVTQVDKLDDLVARMVAHRLLAASLIALGRQKEANEHLNVSLDMFSPELTVNFADRFAQEPGVQIKAYLIFNLWLLGYPDQAAEHAIASRVAAMEIDHVNTTCYGAWHWSIMWELARNYSQADECNGIAFDLGTQHQLLTWIDYAGSGDALTRSRSGDPDAIQLMDDRLGSYISRGHWLMVPYFRMLQASELMRLDRHDSARDVIRDAFEVSVRTNECWTQSELHRLEGEIDVVQSNYAEAEANFVQAIEVARQQDAKSWELRATMSLARLWAAQGERGKALDHLQPVYHWFTEGFETADLCDARQLLEELN